MVSTPATCPLCGAAAEHAFRVGDRNREITSEQFDYARCLSCRTVFLEQPPAALGRYYDNDYYAFADDGQPKWRGEATRLLSARWRASLLGRFASPGPLIEIGAGTGAFALACRDAGWQVSAIEMDERCCRFLRSEGVTAICSDEPVAQLQALGPARAIALWHVLEHVPDPASLLAAIAARLQPRGVLALGVPNTGSLQFRLMGGRWPHVDAPRHLSLVPLDALDAHCAELGLRRVFATTSDPEGKDYDRLGWAHGLSAHPARDASGPGAHAGLALARLLAPVERRGLRGSSLTALFRKER